MFMNSPLKYVCYAHIHFLVNTLHNHAIQNSIINLIFYDNNFLRFELITN